MSRDKTVPVFIAVCAFFVLNRLLVPLMKLPRHVPEVLGLGYYVVLVIISLVLGYLLYGERLQNWLKRPDCPCKDKWLSLLITVVLFLGLGKLLLWLLEVLPPHIWGRHLPRIFYDSLAGFGISHVFIIGERILFGQTYGEHASISQHTLYANGAVMQLHNPFG